MAFKRFSRPELDNGTWFDFGKDPDSGLVIRFRVRRLPADVERRIEAERLGTKRDVRMKAGETIVTPDSEARFAAAIEKAVVSLVDSDNCGFLAGDQAAAELYQSKANGLVATVGEPVALDGKWTEELKRQFLCDEPELAVWVNEKADTLRIRGLEEQARLGKI